MTTKTKTKTKNKNDTIQLGRWICFKCHKTIYNEQEMKTRKHAGLLLKYHKECI